MKNRSVWMLLLGIAATFFASCSGGNSPEKVVEGFVNAINDRDWETAKTLSTPDSESMIDMIKGFADMMPDTTSAFNFEIVSDKTVQEGESASVTIRDENGNEMAYKLKKLEGDWKVDFTMEALMGDVMSEEGLETTIDESLETMEDMTQDLEQAVEDLEGAATK